MTINHLENYLKHKAYSIYMRTTVILHDDIYASLVTRFGKRGISKALNEFAAANLFGKSKRKSMFGSLEQFNLDDVKINDGEFN